MIPFKVGMIATSVVAATLLLTWSHLASYNHGRQVERTETLTRSVEILRERNDTDAKVSAFDNIELCHSLGGVWMQDDNTCQ